MIILKIGIVFLASIFCGCLYRAGGEERKNQWYKFLIHSKTRDIGCSLLTVGDMLMFLDRDSLQGWQASTLVVVGMSICSFLLCWSAISSYGKFLNRVVSRKDKKRIDWLQYTYSGAVWGLSALPMVFCGLSLWAIIGRAGALIVFNNLWWGQIKSDSFSEWGRGFAICASTLIFII